MLNRVTFILAAVFTLALSAVTGCVKAYDPASEHGNAIRFEAGSLLLDDNATSKGTPVEGTEYPAGSTFTVFGSHYSGGSETEVFSGETVTKQAAGYLTYDNPKLWIWKVPGDYYDFVAVNPAGKGTSRMPVAGNIALSTSYDITVEDYDLMAATSRRRGNVLNPKDVVQMQFDHMVSAVRIVVINSSESKEVTIDGISFRNLTVCGDAKATLDAAGNTNLSWINTERSSALVLETLPDEVIPPGERYNGEWNLMIPQRLDQAVGASPIEENMPRLLISYTPDGLSQTTAEIALKNIERSDGTPITSWEMGVKYIYYVSMRLDGGVLVRIETTAWDPVEAETPGLLI